MLNAEDWKSVLRVYSRHPSSAVDLARQLVEIRKALQRGHKAEAIAGIDLAIEELYEHTSFDKAGHKFYHRAIEGTISTKQEKQLRDLGVKF